MGVESALISWSGSMFEYLMPLLVMRSPPESILETTYRAVVRRQIEYGNERQIPWGISEAAYAARDIHLVYQYRAFGVPGLGFERGLSEDLVVAPYATLLATMVEPGDAVRNLIRLNSLGAQGRYGYYEALDFTPEPAARGRGVRPGASLYGPPSGDVTDLRDQRHLCRALQGPLSFGPVGPGGRAVVA